MKTLLLVKEIYLESFKDFSQLLIRNYFKAFSWFSFGMIAIVIYAFVFRVITGFAFD